MSSWDLRGTLSLEAWELALSSWSLLNPGQGSAWSSHCCCSLNELSGSWGWGGKARVNIPSLNLKTAGFPRAQGTLGAKSVR
ncbi:mCG148105 [Mus musculus]|nr:mCG148105 [Mus musculus]